jgi:hypothetical protein
MSDKSLEIRIKLHEIIEDPLLFEPFKDFCKKECSLENILFYEKVEKFKRPKNKEKKIEEAMRIYDSFLKADGQFQLNVNKEDVENIEKTLFETYQITNEIFDPILKNLELLVINDTFIRFQKTDGFIEIYSKITEKKTMNKVIIEEFVNTDDEYTRIKNRKSIQNSLKRISFIKHDEKEKPKNEEKKSVWLEIKKKFTSKIINKNLNINDESIRPKSQQGLETEKDNDDKKRSSFSIFEN